MKTYLFPRALWPILALLCSVTLQAQTPAPKAAAAPADPVAEAAFDAFFKLRDPLGAPTGAKFGQLIKSGVPLITKYPKHRRTSDVIRKLTDVAQGFNDKATVPMRDVWFSQLKLDLLNVPKDDLTDDGRAALAALTAGNANAEARLSRDKDTIETAREKVDALATVPGGARFLADQEMSFVEVLKVHNLAAAEKQARKLTEHADKGLAGRAADEVRLIEVRKAPYELKGTTVDGKTFDAAAVRGKKALYLHFWSAENEASVKEFETLKELYFEHRERLEIVSVNLDTAENRAKAEKVIKEKKAKWPQLVEGEGTKSAIAARLNVRGPANAVLIDQRGMLIHPKARANQVVGSLRQMGYKF